MNFSSLVYNMLQHVTGASFNCINYFKECLLVEKVQLKKQFLSGATKMSFHITGQFWGLFRVTFLSLLEH